MSKVQCPFHNDDTASLELYPDGKYYCFGCAATGPIAKLPAHLANAAPTEGPPLPPENLADTLRYIDSLPIARVRGLDLPMDKESYYVVWPDRTYYNRRFLDGAVKYRCPTGHARKLLWTSPRWGKGPLLIVEGEINALSVALAFRGDRVTVCSPGGAGNFHSKGSEAWIPQYTGYSPIYLVVDEDAAGGIAGIELRARLIKHVPATYVVLMRHDANDWLVEHGAEALRKELIAQTGMAVP